MLLHVSRPLGYDWDCTLTAETIMDIPLSRRGSFVTRCDRQDVEEIFRSCRRLEEMAIERAVGSMTPNDFHTLRALIARREQPARSQDLDG
ncbi:MAG: hypothetical protein JXB85_13090 [Anaerolineales bacterium]|nr:hypothetical protein [Anaerolineales bacterium]